MKNIAAEKKTCPVISDSSGEVKCRTTECMWWVVTSEVFETGSCIKNMWGCGKESDAEHERRKEEKKNAS